MPGRDSQFDMLGRCKLHEWHLYEDRYTTARYRCRHCGGERGVSKAKVAEFEAPRENGVTQVAGRRPAS